MLTPPTTMGYDSAEQQPVKESPVSKWQDPTLASLEKAQRAAAVAKLPSRSGNTACVD